MVEYAHIKRTFGPVFNENSRLLILGSFPSVKSREANFYYGHPQNRFWRVLARVFECEMPTDIEGKKAVLLSQGVALWDTLEECDILGSSDSSIKNAVPVDILRILNAANIRNIYCNGATSFSLFMKYLYPICAVIPIRLPSTSPANAAWTEDRLFGEWIKIRNDL